MTVLDLSTASWRKSSHSSDSNVCVEVAFPEPAWRKSSYSADTSTCVEVAFPGPVVAVRDSKQPHGGALALPATAWTGFLADLRGMSE